MIDELLVHLAIIANAEGLAMAEAGGNGFEVTAIKPGEANGLIYPALPLEAAAHLFTGATVFLNHADAMDHTRPGGRKVEDIAGVVTRSWWDDSNQAVHAQLHTQGPQGQLVERLARQIVADRMAGLPVPNVGLSADMFVTLAKDGRTVTAINRVISLDVVFNPAAGGSFERVLNSAQQKERSNMGEEIVRTESTTETPTPEVATTPARDAGARVAADVRATLADIQRAREQAEKLTQEQLKASCASLLTAALQASVLPAPMKDEVKESFNGRVFQADELTGALKRKEDVYGKLVEGSVIKGMGFQGPIVHGMQNSMDRIQAAANMLFGVTVPDNMKDTPRLSGIRELYVMLTGDYNFHGVFHPERVQLANINTTTMASVVKNAMNVSMLESFNMNPKWWAPIAHEEDFPTMDTVTWLTLGGFGDLPTVAEGAAYTEMTFSDNEETATFLKKGGFVGITLEMIDRDRVSAIRAIPRRIGISAWRTLSSLVSALFTDAAGLGPTLSDTGTLFNATAQATAGGHVNLLTAALSVAAWDAVVQAMFNHTEATSGKKAGIRPAYCLVPIELESTALALFTSDLLPGSANNDRNVRMMPGDRVITVPEWTDTNNWAAAADPAQCPGVCVGYRFGRTPEIFVADDTLTGSMFTNDEMRIKARFVVAVGIGDWKALHKNNVA